MYRYVCAGESRGYKVWSTAGIAELRLWEDSISSGRACLLGVGAGKGVALRQVGTNIPPASARLAQEVPPPTPTAWAAWQAPSHSKPSSRPPAQLCCLPPCRERVQSRPGVGKQSSSVASAQRGGGGSAPRTKMGTIKEAGAYRTPTLALPGGFSLHTKDRKLSLRVVTDLRSPLVGVGRD